MEINIPPKSDDPQRLIALNGVPQKFWLSASEINQMVNVLAFLLGNRSSLYLGEHDSLFDLELAHPDPAPGSYAQILVEDPNQANQKAEWDNDKKKWIVTGDYDYPTPGGSTQPTTRLDSLSVGWIEGYKYHPRAFFTIEDIPYTDDREFTIVPHATLDKLATFAVNIETRKVEILEGDPAENPVELQNIDYNKYLVGPFVIIRGGTTQPDNVEVTNLYQENLGVAGGEADTSGGPDFDFANPDNPAKGNVAIKVIDEITASQLFALTLGTDLPIAKVKQLHVKVQNINPGDFHIRVVGKRRGGRIESLVLPVVTDYGYDPNNIASYQNIILPVVSNQLESIHRVNLVSKVDGWKYYADDIYFSGGESIPDTGGNNYVTLQDLQNYALNDLSNLVSNLSVAQQDVIKTKLGIVAGGGGSYTPPSPYATMQAMYDDQANQVANQTYRVTDASGHSDVNAGRAWFEYKGTLNAAEGDYILKSEEESLNLDQQFDALQQQITANANNITSHNTRLNALEGIDNVVTVDTSRLLGASDIGKVLYVIASVTLTWPAAGIPGFKANLECNDTGAATIADEAGTPGDDLSAPNGTEIAADETAYLFIEPVGSKLRISK